jgi:deazaflavin-dependent oxidoreductase (nitroreductase family)
LRKKTRNMAQWWLRSTARDKEREATAQALHQDVLTFVPYESTHEGGTQMSNRNGSAAGVPWTVSLFSPVLRFLIAAGVPMGFNGLITIRGRKSGLPRTTPVAIIAVSGRRWVWAPWGEVHWVRNLRAAGRATITVRRRKEEVTATELDPTQRVEFFRDILGPLARSIPLGITFIRIADGVDLNRPLEAAEGRVVLELHPV